MAQDIDFVRGALWLRPAGAALETLGVAIRRLRGRRGGPGAWPHVSLGGGIACPREDMERRLAALAARLDPFTIRLGAVDGRNEYWRSVFVAVHLDAALRSAHAAACEIFGLDEAEPFEPHVSLLYGPLPERERHAIVADLGDSLALRFDARHVEFVNATAGLPVLQWRTLARRELGAEAGALPAQPRERAATHPPR